nr:DUF3085 domain-containing protein [Novacetimonas pomaceti]
MSTSTLLSNGYPGFSDAEGQANLVAYAVEADPRTRPDDWYDVKRASFGGDDGAEFLSADTIRKALEATVGSRLWIDVTPARISCPYLASPQKNDPDDRMADLERPALNKNTIKTKYINK